MKLVSWNVNGLRACIQKGFLEQFDAFDADFFCLQETKLSEGQLELDLPGYEQYWCYAQKKGYSGTAIFTKHTPMSVQYGLGIPELDTEGRVITLEYPEFYLLTCYTPNAQRELARIDHRMKWDEAFRDYIQRLDAVKPVILCGDLNVAHQEIDLKNPKSNRGSAGFSDQERESFQKTLDAGFTDTFRHLHPDKTGAYSWWSYMFKAREKNAGWRIDYFLISDRLQDRLYRADIHSEILGSDHCPVSVEMGLIVNGGLWSPLQQGNATQVLPEGENVKDAPKASAKLAKALVAFCMIAALITTFFLWYEPPISDEPSITESAFVTHLFNTMLSHSYQPSDNTTGVLLINPNHLMDDAKKSYYLSIGIDRSTMGGDFCLRVDVSQQLQRRYGEEMTIKIRPMHPSNEINYSMVYRKYYTNEQYTEFDGWLVFGTLDKPTEFEITVSTGEATYVDSVLISPFFYRDPDVPQIDNACQVTIFNKPPSTTPAFTDHGSATYITDETINFQRFLKELYDGRDLSQWNSWFYVALTRSAANQLDGIDLELNATRIIYGLDEDVREFLHISEVYSDSACTQFTGWLVYGQLNATTNVHFNLCPKDTKISIWETTVHANPYLPEEDVTIMTTEALCKYLVDNDYIMDIMLMDQMTALRDFPALQELITRNDAVVTLMSKPIVPENSKWAVHKLLQNYLMDQMLPLEESAFYVGDYLNSDDTSQLNEIKVSGDLKLMDTATLLERAIQFTEPWYLSGALPMETLYHIYTNYWCKLNPYWQEFATRSDALAILNQKYQQTPNSTYLTLTTLFSYIPDRQNAENMTNQELLEYVLGKTALCMDITSGYLFNHRYHKYSDPYLSVLFSRPDATDVLMNYEIPHNDPRCQVIVCLLVNHFDRYYTPQQAARAVTGLYPGATSLGYRFDYATDPKEATTAQLVNALWGENSMFLKDFFISAEAYSEADTVSYEIYKLVLPYSNILQELQLRPDAISQLRMVYDPMDYNKRVINEILTIYETYPEIWSGIQDAVDAISLADASSWITFALSDSNTQMIHCTDHQLYTSGDAKTTRLPEANFAYFVTVPHSYMDDFTFEQLELRVQIQIGQIAGENYFFSIPCFSDVNLTKFSGWLIYGKQPEGTGLGLSVCLKPTDAGNDVYLTGCQIDNIFDKENVVGIHYDQITTTPT